MVKGYATAVLVVEQHVESVESIPKPQRKTVGVVYITAGRIRVAQWPRQIISVTIHVMRWLVYGFHFREEYVKRKSPGPRYRVNPKRILGDT